MAQSKELTSALASLASQHIDNLRSAGAVTELDGTAQALALNRELVPLVEAQADAAERYARATGVPRLSPTCWAMVSQPARKSLSRGRLQDVEAARGRVAVDGERREQQDRFAFRRDEETAPAAPFL